VFIALRKIRRIEPVAFLVLEAGTEIQPSALADASPFASVNTTQRRSSTLSPRTPPARQAEAQRPGAGAAPVGVKIDEGDWRLVDSLKQSAIFQLLLGETCSCQSRAVKGNLGPSPVFISHQSSAVTVCVSHSATSAEFA